MKELTPGMMIAVFEEIFGPFLFWAMVAIAVLITLAYLYVLIRDRSMHMRKFLFAQLSMPLGAVAAVWFVQAVTHSNYADLGGPIDAIIYLAVALVGAIGTAILVYTLQSLFRGAGSARRKAREIAGGHAPRPG